MKDHPTIQKFKAGEITRPTAMSEPLSAAWLRESALQAGADDVGFVAIDRPELDVQREDLLKLFPAVKTIMPFVVKMNKELTRSPLRDGWFDFNACFTHNYREFLGGFTSWVDAVADRGSAGDYNRQFDKGETVSIWQSLAYGPNYKAAYCMAVCPAGEDVIFPYLDDKRGFLQEVVKPLQEKAETIYVTPGADAEAHVQKRYPHKTVKQVSNGASVTTIRGFTENMVHFFQRGKSEGLNAVYHFIFTGDDPINITVTIRDQTIHKQEGLHGAADLTITADGEAWVRFLNSKSSGIIAFLRRKIRLQGDPRLLIAFGNCFPF